MTSCPACCFNNLNLHIIGSSLAQLKQACGVDNFIALFRTTLRAVYDLENDEVGNISVFELNIEGMHAK